MFTPLKSTPLCTSVTGFSCFVALLHVAPPVHPQVRGKYRQGDNRPVEPGFHHPPHEGFFLKGNSFPNLPNRTPPERDSVIGDALVQLFELVTNTALEQFSRKAGVELHLDSAGLILENFKAVEVVLDLPHGFFAVRLILEVGDGVLQG